ncbi:MAG: hypothetical protein ACREX3_01580 [Gammaproteobacteria bacterium]
MSSVSATPQRDTVPRVQHVPYFQTLLDGVGEEQSFDELRMSLRQAAVDLTRRAGGRVAASRVGDAYTAWSTTADALGELMRLGLVERKPLPSKRDNVDAHRASRFALTAEGQRLEEETRRKESAFRAAIAPLLIQSHPYFAAVLDLLAHGPLVLPEYTEEMLRGFKDADGHWIPHLGADAAARIQRSMPGATTSADEVTARLTVGLRRRFTSGTAPRPKAVLDTVQDILVAATLTAFELKIDAVTFNVLASWGSYLYVLSESRYVAGVAGRVMWETADITRTGEGIVVQWRGLKAFGDRVAKELAQAYRELADDKVGGEPGYFPYVPIYEVRALAAYRVGVSDQIVDRVIAELADQTRPAAFRVELALGAGNWQATSERPFRLGERRYYVILIKPEPQAERSNRS